MDLRAKITNACATIEVKFYCRPDDCKTSIDKELIYGPSKTGSVSGLCVKMHRNLTRFRAGERNYRL